MPNDYRVVRPADSSDLAMDVIAVMWEDVNFYDSPSALDDTLLGTTPGQRAIYACTWYMSEVNNGGHDQFFGNSTGAIWPQAAAGFRLLESPAYGAILGRALAKFGVTEPSRDRAKRQGQLDVLSDGAFDDLDTSFYALQEQQPLDAFFLRYIDATPDDFFK